MDASDTALVSQALAGDREAFGRLVHRPRPMLLRLALRLLSEAAEAEDVAQEASLVAFLTLDRLQEPERFGSWLAGIGLNLSRMRLRRTGSAARNLDLAGGMAVQTAAGGDEPPSPEAVYEARERHTAILTAIRMLPPDQQAAVRLHYLEGLSLSEAAVIEGVPPGTVKARLHRARQRLRLALGEPAPISVSAEAEPMEAIMVEVIVDSIRRGPMPPELIENVRTEILEAASGQSVSEGDAPVWKPLPAGPDQVTVMLLREREGARVLPLWIGPHDGDVLAQLLFSQATLRPMPPELAARLMEAGQMTLERVGVTKLQDQIFYATLWVKAGDGIHEIDARPSDGVALALRLKAPIFVDEALLESKKESYL
jgi:RNA polymerase sigma factor (sigma-70 family)